MIITVWTYGEDGLGLGGISPSNDQRFVQDLVRHGHAIVTDSRHARPMNHNIVGCGVGHNDAEFAETSGRGGSMAAYYENGDAWGGRWWEDVNQHFSNGVKYYGCRSTGTKQPRRAVSAMPIH